MSNWMHQVLTVRNRELSAVAKLVECAVTIHARTGYLDSMSIRDGHALFFLEDRYTPLFCVARAVSSAVPDALVTLTWIEPINVMSGSAFLRDGRVVAYREIDCCDHVEWAEQSGVMRRYRREYEADPRIGDFAEELEAEYPLDDFTLPNCDVCDGTDCCSNGGLQPMGDDGEAVEGDPK